jgi:hypothetical protein
MNKFFKNLPLAYLDMFSLNGAANIIPSVEVVQRFLWFRTQNIVHSATVLSFLPFTERSNMNPNGCK